MIEWSKKLRIRILRFYVFIKIQKHGFYRFALLHTFPRTLQCIVLPGLLLLSAVFSLQTSSLDHFNSACWLMEVQIAAYAIHVHVKTDSTRRTSLQSGDDAIT